MKAPQIDGSGTPRGRRGIVLIVAGAIALALGASGIGAVLARGPSSAQTQPDAVAPVTPTPVAPPAMTNPSPSAVPAESSPSAEPALDPTALADGVYPTFVRAVDIQGATVTVDVLQVFVEGAAHRAAIEDGVPWRDVMYDPVYIRNENPLLRTLPVAGDVLLTFVGGCDAPSRQAALIQLRREAVGNDTYYYEMAVIEGSVVALEQRIAISAC
jgi:hypothetical protein